MFLNFFLLVNWKLAVATKDERPVTVIEVIVVVWIWVINFWISAVENENVVDLIEISRPKVNFELRNIKKYLK